MRRRSAMCVIYAIIAMGIGLWVACNDDAPVSTVPIRDAAEPGILPEARKTSSHPDGEVNGREVRHGDGHRVWLERANPGSALQLCEGDAIPALVLRRNDPLGEIHAWVYVSDPELENDGAHGETRHAGNHVPTEEEFELAAGELSVSISNLGKIHDCPGCGELRNVLVGIASIHDHDDGSDHVETYEIRSVLTFSVRKGTDAVCLGAAGGSLDGQ